MDEYDGNEQCDMQTAIKWGVSIHWTGLLDWNTGLDYWTEVFPFFGQDSVVFGLLQIFDIWRPQIKLEYFCDLTMSTI